MASLFILLIVSLINNGLSSTPTCYCPTSQPTFATTTTAPPTTKSGKTKTAKSSGKGGSGIGIGDCDCDKGYGVVELRFIYQGTRELRDVGSIEFFYDLDNNRADSDIVCSFDDIGTNDEIICQIDSRSDDFDTHTPFTIHYADGAICEDQYHTSCSSDIVGMGPENGVCDDIICSGWKSSNGNPEINDCDDGQEPCDCDDDTIIPSTNLPTKSPESVDIVIGDNCYCELRYSVFTFFCDFACNILLLISFLLHSNGMTPSPEAVTAKSGKTAGKSKDSTGLGVGDCSCDDKHYGMVSFRVLYSGDNNVDITFQHKDSGDIMCTVSNVATGQEAECNVNSYVDGDGDPIFDKLSPDTYVELFTAGTSSSVCSTKIHTSCSRDIVGTYGDDACGTDIIVSGWSDGDPVSITCDDGYDLCPCYDDTQIPTASPTYNPTTNIPTVFPTGNPTASTIYSM